VTDPAHPRPDVSSAQVGLDDVSVLVDGLDHPECVTVGPDGTLYAGGEAGQIYRIDVETGASTEIATTGGWLLGVAVDGDHGVIGCDPKRHEVVYWTPGGQVQVLSNGSLGRPMTTPNFAVLYEHGMYVSDSGGWGDNDGRIYRIDAHGGTEIWTEALTAFPNGMALNAKGDGLFVAQSTEPGVWRIPVRSDGSAGSPEPRGGRRGLSGHVG